MEDKTKAIQTEYGYIHGRHGDGFQTNGTDYKTFEICLGEKGLGEDLLGWLKLRVSFNHYFDLIISNEAKEVFRIEECNLGVLVGLRDFLNYAIKD